jgi:hypothetical protein
VGLVGRDGVDVDSGEDAEEPKRRLVEVKSLEGRRRVDEY